MNEFKIPTYEEILAKMMGNITDSLDKREGSMVYNALAPAAAELAQLYIQLSWMVDQSFPDTADRHHLIRRAIERGMKPYPATKAVLRIHYVPAETVIPENARFNLDELNYKLLEIEDPPGYMRVECETPGALGNRGDGELIPISFIPGLETAHVESIATPAQDEESTEDFRRRYLGSFHGLAYGGNVADYQQKVMEIPGVGQCKVIPIWDGGGTVKLIILGDDQVLPTPELIAQIQEAIDPIPSGGQGIGIAPIGHRVTVEAAVQQTVDIDMLVTPSPGFNFLDLRPQIMEALTQMLRAEIKNWSQRQLKIQEAKISWTVSAIPGVENIQYITINGAADDFTLPAETVPVLGAVTNNGVPLKKSSSTT